MTIQRISTYAVHQNTLRDVNGTQSRLVDLQKQLSSGFKTERFKGMPGQVEQFTQLEAKIRKTDGYIRNNEVILSRLNTTQVTLDKIIDISDDIEDLMVLRRSANADNIEFPLQMENLRKSVAKMLNSTFEGRYIFSGTATNVPPVQDEPFPAPVEVGTPDDGYYQGSKENVFVRAQDNFEIEYNVRADNPAFQKIFGAIEQALQGHTAEDDDEQMVAALDMLQSGLEGVITEQTKVNANIVAMENINERHVELKLYWQGVTETIINTDVVSVSTEVAIDQTILQATFQTFARVNQLRLADFL